MNTNHQTAKMQSEVGHTRAKQYVSVAFDMETSKKLKQTAESKCYSVAAYIRMAVKQALSEEA